MATVEGEDLFFFFLCKADMREGSCTLPLGEADRKRGKWILLES